MLSHEIILLGILKENPTHGYEIKKKIKAILSLFAGINIKSIYYPLRVMEKKGLVVKKVNKQGRRPQRLVYALTPKGESRFNALLAKSFLDFTRPQFSIDLSLYFLPYIDPRIARRRLRARIFVLNGLAKRIRQMAGLLKKKKNHAPSYILEHNLHILEAESSFLNRLLRQL